MTEFKKVQQLLDDVKEHVVYIHSSILNSSTPSPYSVYGRARDQLVSSASDLVRRGHKLYTKATEKDPNKQIYNETMCGRIADLYQNIAEFMETSLGVSSETLMSIVDGTEGDCVLASSDLCSKMTELYEAAVVQEAHTSAWNDAVASSIVSLVEREVVMRVVLEVEEKNAQKMIASDARESRAAARQAEDARAAALWELEQHRRSSEHLLPAAPSVAAVFDNMTSDRATCALRTRLATLLREVRANPERQGIRVLRYVPLTLEHFGHPCVRLHGGGCCCKEINYLAEGVLRMAGYQPRYNNAPSHNAVVMQSFSASGPSFALPCGGSSNDHEYVPLGFEPYGERTLVLVEPDPQTEMDRWWSWHERLGVIIADLGM